MKYKVTCTLLFAVLASFGWAESQDVDRPNILFIIADDCTYSDLPLYGGQNVATPRIDRLASEGLVFNKAYVSMAMCVPCRSALYTGLYPLGNGSAWNHSPSIKGTKSMPHYLGDAGYRVGIAGKIHVEPESVYPFERVPGVERNPVAKTSDFDAVPLREFMERDADQPFALVVGITSPHVPWTVGNSDNFDPHSLIVPDNLPDTPQIRESLTHYLAEIEVLDEQLGGVLDALEASGKAEQTIVLFTSEQGAQFPGAKWTNWDSGVHTGLVVRWPGNIAAGRTDALVQYCDILPTVLDLAKVPYETDRFDGTSFGQVLNGQASTHRRYAYFLHNNIPEGPSYPIRGITDGRFHYIRNLSPEEIYIEKHMFALSAHSPYMGSIFWASTDDKNSYDLIKRFMSRPGEELYDNTRDKYQLTNLAQEVEFSKQRAKLSNALDRWMAEQDDPGAEMDTWPVYRSAREMRHSHFDVPSKQ